MGNTEKVWRFEAKANVLVEFELYLDEYLQNWVYLRDNDKRLRDDCLFWGIGYIRIQSLQLLLSL